MGDSLLQEYFARFREALKEREDGAWIGGDEHQQLFADTIASYPSSTQDFLDILTQEHRLPVRFEALRLMVGLDLKVQLLPVIEQQLERTGFFPLFRRRLETLRELWQESPVPDSDLERLTLEWQRGHWFGAPGDTEAQVAALQGLAALGEVGLTRIEHLLGSLLEDSQLMNHSALVSFRESARLFVEHQCFEGVQIFFDFLGDCRPIKTNSTIKKTVGEVLKAVRKLRPYRYPQWAVPLRSFVRHFKSIRRAGRAAEANMLIILITASTLEQALLLEDDELVDLLRGRRDAAYTTEDLDSAASLCEAVLEAGRTDGRIYHILGWLIARLDGPEAAAPFFLEALERLPGYVYSHLAVAALAEMAGDYALQDEHLGAACSAEPTLISCHRKLGQILAQEGYTDEAMECYYRGTLTKPADTTVYELEEWFGCFLGRAELFQKHGEETQALEELERLLQMDPTSLFSSRFLNKEHLILSMLYKGIEDYKSELQRSLPVQESSVTAVEL